MPVADSSISLSVAGPWCVSKPSKPVTYRPHKPGHRLRRVHLDEVHVRIPGGSFFCSETEAAPSRERQLPLPRSRHRVLNPLGISLLAELVRPPDGQLEADRGGTPAQFFDADRVRARLAGQVQLVVLVHQRSRDAQLARFDPFDLPAVT